jgi:hypothetical protein
LCGEPADRVNDREPSAGRALGVILMRLGIAEINEHAVAHIFGDKTAKPGNGVGDRAVVAADQLAQVLGIKAGGQWRRADQIAEHHGQLPPLRLRLGGSWCITRCHCHPSGGHRGGFECTLGQGGDSIQQATAMPDRRNPEFAQIVGG